MSLLLRPRPGDLLPPEKRRNRSGIATIFKTAMVRGQKVTLAEAIIILRANW